MADDLFATSTQNTWARANSWLILRDDEAYQKQIYSNGGSLFLYKLDDGLWQLIYQSQTSYGTKSRTIVKGGRFERCADEAKNFTKTKRGG